MTPSLLFLSQFLGDPLHVLDGGLTSGRRVFVDPRRKVEGALADAQELRSRCGPGFRAVQRGRSSQSSCSSAVQEALEREARRSRGGEVEASRARIAEPCVDGARGTQILELGDNFERVWRDERCPVELKKKIIRTAIDEVIVDVDEDKATLRSVVHCKGGTQTRFEMPKPLSGAGRKRELEDLAIIRKMASRRYGDDEIARVLVNRGRKTAKGKSWTKRRVKSVGNRYSIAGQKRTVRGPAILTRNEAARHCGVSVVTIKRLVEGGILDKEQVVPWAPWEIRRADLDSAPVREALRRLQETGRLGLKGDDSAAQLTFFEQ